MKSKTTEVIIGAALIVVGLVCAWLGSYKQIHLAFFGVAFGAFGGRMIGEAYQKGKK